jgi:hypothetical protein
MDPNGAVSKITASIPERYPAPPVQIVFYDKGIGKDKNETADMGMPPFSSSSRSTGAGPQTELDHSYIAAAF